MKTHPFAKQVQANYWIYNIEVLRLTYKTKHYNNLQKSLKKLKTLNLPKQSQVESKIYWELQGIESDIEELRQWLKWYKTRPLWIPLG